MTYPRIFLRPALAASLAALFACGPKQHVDPIEQPADPGDRVEQPPPMSPDAIIAASDLPAPAPASASDPMGVEIHRLSNGMTVYISTDRTIPKFSSWIAVRAGSRNDPADSTGLAHYLEHMLFKGSSKLASVDFVKEKAHLDNIASLYAQLRQTDEDDSAKRAEIFAAIDAATIKSAAFAVPNEFDQLYAGMGITGLNAFTSDDETVYIATVPSNKLEAWAKVEGDRFADPQYRLFYPELEAVYEEKNRSLDSPSSRVFDALTRAMFPKHPYGTQPTIGTVDHLKTPAYGDMVEFYNRWYVPNNMAIVLAGDIDAKRALPVLEREFARLAPKPLPTFDNTPLPGKIEPLTERTEIEIVAPGQNTVYLGWQAVAATHPDAEVYEVFDMLLDNSTSGLLNTELLLTQKLPGAGSFISSMREAGYAVIYGTARSNQKPEEVEALLQGVLAKIKRGEVTQADIDAVIVNEEISEKRKLESNRARASAMGNAFLNRMPWPVAMARLERLRKVKVADIVRVAKTLDENVVVVHRKAGTFEPPKIDKPKITPVPIDTSKASPFATAIKAMPAAPLAPKFLVADRDYRELKLPAGPLITAHNDKNDLFSVSYAWDLGYRNTRQLCLALDALEKSGTATLDATALQKKLYQMGTTIRFSCGVDSTSISVSGIDRNLESSIALLRSWLDDGVIAAPTISKLVENQISTRADQIKEPRLVAAALTAYAQLGARSSYLAQLSNAELRTMARKKSSPKALSKALRSLSRSSHDTTYFGPREPTTGAELAPVLGLGKKHRKVAPPPRIVYRKVGKPIIYFANKTAAQAQVRLVFPQAPLPREQRQLSFLYTEYVGGGLGALIPQQIREARGLAYSAWGGYDPGSRPRDASALYAGLGTQANKTPEALAAILELLGSLGKLEEQRLTVAKASLIESYSATRPNPRGTPGFVLSWRDLGYKSDPRPAYFETLKKTDAAALAAFAGPLTRQPFIIAITGDKTRIDMKALAKIATIKEVEPGALVSW